MMSDERIMQALLGTFHRDGVLSCLVLGTTEWHVPGTDFEGAKAVGFLDTPSPSWKIVIFRTVQDATRYHLRCIDAGYRWHCTRPADGETGPTYDLSGTLLPFLLFGNWCISRHAFQGYPLGDRAPSISPQGRAPARFASAIIKFLQICNQHLESPTPLFTRTDALLHTCGSCLHT